MQSGEIDTSGSGHIEPAGVSVDGFCLLADDAGIGAINRSIAEEQQSGECYMTLLLH